MRRTVGQRIRSLREKREWSQLFVSEKTGINNSVLSRIEADKRPIESDELNIFANLFEVSADYLLGRTNDPNRTLQPHSRKLIDMIDAELTDEDILKEFNDTFLIDGIPISREEAISFITFVRTKRIMEKQQDSALGSGKV